MNKNDSLRVLFSSLRQMVGIKGDRDLKRLILRLPCIRKASPKDIHTFRKESTSQCNLLQLKYLSWEWGESQNRLSFSVYFFFIFCFSFSWYYFCCCLGLMKWLPYFGSPGQGAPTWHAKVGPSFSFRFCTERKIFIVFW